MESAHSFFVKLEKIKAKSNYRGSAKNPATQKVYIHFFIDNSNVNCILYNLSCPKLKSGQLKVKELMPQWFLEGLKFGKKNWKIFVQKPANL